MGVGKSLPFCVFLGLGTWSLYNMIICLGLRKNRSVENPKSGVFMLVKSTQGAGLIGDAAFDFLLIISMPNVKHSDD